MSAEQRGILLQAPMARDMYDDASQVWNILSGSGRRPEYRKWLVETVKSRNPARVLDAACADGVDSIILLEEGIPVTSTDYSEKMVLLAMKNRWNRRKEPAFDDWVIDTADWMTLQEDFQRIPHPADGFDVIICMGNSFCHIPNPDGSNKFHEVGLRQLWSMVSPGGLLIIDHRNFEDLLQVGHAQEKNFMKHWDHIHDMYTSITYIHGRAVSLTEHFTVENIHARPSAARDPETGKVLCKFELTCYPFALEEFTRLLDEATGEDQAEHTVLGDGKPVDKNGETPPAFYQHLVEKKK